MATGAHTISGIQGSHRKKKRVGRGNGSQKGTFSSRGMKGQRSRSGGKSGGKLRGIKQALQKVPKLRGFKSMHPKAQSVSLATLERMGEVGVTITPTFLKEKSVIKNISHPVKIVASGELKKKLTIQGCNATKAAAIAVEKAGGTLSF
ncbi:MAG: 50S ribosomal protein L15 [Candidatus Magasanikbacteria bacterium CG10_big_fil_rev_8_21_14_0_10_42_10]|uniref:Large ribosomal subunit protein uL15 n=2 Tax=Candidatus Magasanikiibacteriota TaxID=1752731 RepID=A0A2H0TV87_9BACT|nr:MAG: 50S ribosomal protein L15 [Candidatus Magasanikbacteria bacterium CG10_big_fil_rev_8_21_14_0_10_42_10]PIZ94288.1 MAG: 50S ribosomal protein L15 [Candidatus Magasanikbacteria bacterium CG_4_10_14_0_2_um_filter_41_10]